MDKIPAEILKELNINQVEEKPKDFEATPVVEKHQVKLPIPRKLLNQYDLNLKKGTKIKLTYDEKKGELIYKIKCK